MAITLDDVVSVLIEEGCLQGPELIPPRQPGHGSCCTCQICGRAYEDCVCDHNRILTALKKLES